MSNNNLIEYYIYTPTQQDRLNKAATAMRDIFSDPYLQRYLRPELTSPTMSDIVSFAKILLPSFSKPVIRQDLETKTITLFKTKAKLKNQLKNSKVIIQATNAHKNLTIDEFLNDIHFDHQLKPIDDEYQYLNDKFSYKKLFDARPTKDVLKEQLGDYAPNNSFDSHRTIVASSCELDPFLTKLHRRLGSLYPKDPEYEHIFVQGLVNPNNYWFQVPVIEVEDHKIPLITSVPAPNMFSDVLQYLSDKTNCRLAIWNDHQFKKIGNDWLPTLLSNYNDATEYQTIVINDMTSNQHFYVTHTIDKMIEEQRTQSGIRRIVKNIPITVEFGTMQPAKLDDDGKLLNMYYFDKKRRLRVSDAKNSGIYLEPVEVAAPSNQTK